VLRKTDREVYRWIANTHYKPLAKALVHFEDVHEAGCTFGDLLATTSREQFVSLSAEVLVADDLRRRGYTVRTIPHLGQPGPDLHVNVDGIDVAVEVYTAALGADFEGRTALLLPFDRLLGPARGARDEDRDAPRADRRAREQPVTATRGVPRPRPRASPGLARAEAAVSRQRRARSER
jgi:hypothetical protein